MTTAVELLDWSLQYKDVAGDGFKAEMLWLARLSDNPDHPASVQTFELPEWKYFANYLFPSKYPVISITNLVRLVPYENEQLEAIKDLPSVLHSHEVNLNGTLNEVCHRVIWTARFGLDKFTNAGARTHLQSYLMEDLSNDDYAKVILALRCLGDTQDYPRITTILSDELTVQTYHEQLCALISNKLR